MSRRSSRSAECALVRLSEVYNFQPGDFSIDRKPGFFDTPSEVPPASTTVFESVMALASKEPDTPPNGGSTEAMEPSSLENASWEGMTSQDMSKYCRRIAEQAKVAASQLAGISTAFKNDWLDRSADRLQQRTDLILEANRRDVDQALGMGLSPAAIDRLTLTPDRIGSIAEALRSLSRLPDPVGEILGGSTRPNGLQIQKVRVPIGVLLFIYESRPNVTVDAAAIAIKSGNAIILRGGKESLQSSTALVTILEETSRESGLPDYALQLVRTPDRTAVGELLQLADCIDLVIPRGGESLIRRVVAEASMPVLKHYDGNCHVYVDEHADLEMAIRIVRNAKTQRMGVCNAAESLVVHRAIAQEFLPRLAKDLSAYGIELRGDPDVLQIVTDATPATEADWSTEYLGPILSVRIVDSLDAAVTHIQRYGSHHTDAIVTKDISHARRFAQTVDSAAVMINASTRFNDGGELGLGAEIGISTDKLHARGPCGLQELTTYKYIVTGDGHVRE
jgi:glutamate-5-semialdehyde dehydrogenase